jgi:hypothetical protein
VSDPTRAQDTEDTAHITKIIEEFRRWGLNVDVVKTEYLNIGNGIQNMKLTEIKGSMAFIYIYIKANVCLSVCLSVCSRLTI